MSLLSQALRAGLAKPPASGAGAGHLVIAGGAGPLGAAVLEQALAASAWPRVSALVTQAIEVALRDLHAVTVRPDLGAPARFDQPPETAIVVFDRERSLHGREAAFLRPQPAQLPLLARWLQEHGTRRLLLVLPHAPSLLPQALKVGLAALDEQAVAALGFEQFVIVRPTRTGAAAADDAAEPASRVGRSLSRLARGILSQLSLMVPQRDQPLRAVKVAQFVVGLARALPQAPAGTRVAPPELLWDWAQPDGGDAVLQAWLVHGEWQGVRLPKPRL